MSDQEFITPVVFPKKPVIYKVEKEDGSRKYCSESRGQYRSLDVQEEDLIDDLDMIFNHFYQIIQMFDNDFFEGFVLDTIVIHLKKHIKSLDHFIRQEIGMIRVETIDDEIVGVSVKPIDKNG